ncbi:UNVERIFIED_CONTAM: hypothetical protein GTU68_001053 [Idotea baltica]|nr:hypothetical protein [Idotea baltica]
MLSLLGIPYETIELEKDGSNQPENYLTISPFGQVPVIDDNGIQLADSNAILVYLAKTYSVDDHWLPEDPIRAAKVQRWLSIAAGEMVSGPAIARFSKIFNREIDYETVEEKSHALFSMINNNLSDKKFLTGDSINIADVAGYTYIAHAPEGGLKLDEYPNILVWLDRIRQQKGFISMASSPDPE